MNFVVGTLSGDEFLDTEEVTGELKCSRFYADLITEYLERVERELKKAAMYVVTDNPNVMKEARSMIETEHTYLLTGSCTPHGISKWIEDVCNLPSIKEVLKKHDYIVKKFRNKQWLHTQLKLVQYLPKLKNQFTSTITLPNGSTYRKHQALDMRHAWEVLKG